MNVELFSSEQTLALLKKRDRRMQETVWRAEKSRVEAVAVAILGSRDEAEHVTADLFTDFFYRYVDNVRNSRSIPKYLRLMAQRRSVKRKTGRARLVPLEQDDSADEQVTDVAGDIDDRKLLHWLERCYDKLQPRSRKILKLHYGHEMSYSTIAESFGNSKQAIGKTVKKSLSALKTCVEKQQVREGRLRVPK